MYDIETSKSIEQAANASFKAIFNQLSMSDAEYAKQCTEQLQRIQKLTREKDALQEENRKLKYEMTKRDLEEKAKEIAEENGSECGSRTRLCSWQGCGTSSQRAYLPSPAVPDTFVSFF